MKLGIGSYTFGWATGAYGQPSPDDGRTYLTSEQLIDKAVLLDLPLVQLCVRPELHLLTDEQLRMIAAYAAKSGVTIEIGTTGSDPGNLLRYLAIAEILGARLVRTIFPDASSGLRRERTNLREVVGEYAAAGVVLAVENHEHYSFLELEKLCAGIDSQFLRVCLDPVNSLGAGEGIREVVTCLLPYTAGLHIKDFAVTRSSDNQIFTITGAQLGNGRLDIRWLLDRVVAEKPGINLVVEQWTPFDRSWEATLEIQEQWASHAATLLRRLLPHAQTSRDLARRQG